MAIDIGWIKEKIEEGEYEFSSHAEGEILENYPDDPRGPSCLILGYGEEGYPIHIVCGKTPSDRMRIITVYILSLPKWVDPRTKNKVIEALLKKNNFASTAKIPIANFTK